jgi:hypothetical protein
MPANPELRFWAKPDHLVREYESLLGLLRHERFALLELGVFHGDSLAMWRDGFPRATIVGVDVRHYYFAHYCGMVIAAEVVEMRCGPLMEPAKRRVVRRFPRSERAMAWLALRSPRRATGRTETLRREQALLGGLAWRYYAEARKRLRPLREKQSTGGSEPALRSSDRHAHPIDGARANSASAPGPASTGDGPPGSEPWLLPILVDYFTRDGSTLMMRLLCTSPHVVVDDQYPYERKYFNYLWHWSRLLDRGESPSESWGSSSLAAISQEWHVPLLRAAAVAPPPAVRAGPRRRVHVAAVLPARMGRVLTSCGSCHGRRSGGRWPGRLLRREAPRHLDARPRCAAVDRGYGPPA